MGIKISAKRGSGKISLLSATLLGVTCIVGSGWLFSPQLNARLMGNWAFAVWVAAAIFIYIIALCLIPIVTTYPVRGAITRSSALSHSPVFGMPLAFANWFGILAVIPTEAQATVQYLAGSLKEQSIIVDGHFTMLGKVVCAGVLCLYLLVNFFGVKVLARLNNPLTIFKLSIPILVIIVLLIGYHDASNFSLPANIVTKTPSLSEFLAAIVGTGMVYAFNGFQIPLAFASEIKNPKRTIPLALLFAIVIALIIYLGVQWAFMGAVPHPYLLSQGGWHGVNFNSPLVELSLLLGINWLGVLLMIDASVSPSSTGYTYLGSASRMFFAMAKEGQVPKQLTSPIHPIYKLSHRSLLVNFAFTMVVLFCANSWTSLMLLVSALHLVGYFAAPLSMGGIKPSLRAPGLVVFLAICVIYTLISHDAKVITASTLSILMVVYASTQYQLSKVPLKSLLLQSAPILLLLWVLVTSGHLGLNLFICALLYLWATHPRYVKFCHRYRKDDASLLQETLDVT